MSGLRALTELWVDQAPMKFCISASLTAEAEMIDVTSLHGHSQPHPKWTHVDSNGHWHAAAVRHEPAAQVWYPTLEEHKEPNPEFDIDLRDWEEYDEPEWLAWRRCLICAERVDPAIMTSFERRYVAGRPVWRIGVEVADTSWSDAARSGALYTVRGVQVLPPSGRHLSGGRREWFGVARWHAVGLHDRGGEPATVTGTFEGVGDFGERVG